MANQNPNESPFQAKMRRMQKALEELQARSEEWHRRGGPYAGQDWGRMADAHAQHQQWRALRQEWKEQKRLARARRHEEKRRRRELRRQSGGKPEGIVFAVMAAVAIFIALSNPHALWWLLFVALGFGQAAARLLTRGSAPAELPEDREQDSEEREEESQRQGEGKRDADARQPSPPDPTSEADARVDAVCDKLLAEVRAGPNILREVVRNPEQTVEALRTSCKDLSRRERELRALYTPEDERRLASERDALSARIEAEKDLVAQGRLKEALAALDAQRRQRAELATAAARLGAEHTRLYYTLENLYAQVLRVRSADTASADVAGAGLRKSLEQLGNEMDAVAEALESVHGDDARRMEPISDPSGDSGGGSPPGGRERV